MVRPREFEVDGVLDSAMHLFWSQGYGATSLDDICEATGLNRSSLYSSFGDKRTLLLMSLERYIEFGPSRIAHTLAQAIPIRRAMAQLLSDFVQDIVAGPGRSGCFVGNCAVELAHHDKRAMQLVREGMRKTEGALLKALTRAQARGELRIDADVAALARFYMCSLQGLHMVGKVSPDRQALEDLSATMLRLLD